MDDLTRQVVKIAELARIRLSDEEKRQFAKQLPRIVEYIGKIGELDTSSVSAHEHVTKNQNVFRDDEAKNCAEETKSAALAAFPSAEDSLLKVPGIFENRVE